MKHTRIRVAAVAALIAAVAAGLTGCAPADPRSDAKSVVTAYLDAAKAKDAAGMAKLTTARFSPRGEKTASKAVLAKIEPIQSYEITDVRPTITKALVKVSYKIAGKTYKTSLDVEATGNKDERKWYVAAPLASIIGYTGKFTTKVGNTTIPETVIAVPGKVKVAFTNPNGYYKTQTETPVLKLNDDNTGVFDLKPELAPKGEKFIESIIQGYLATYNGGWYYGGNSILDMRGFSYLAQQAAGGNDSGPYKLLTPPTATDFIREVNGGTHTGYRVSLTGGHWGVITRVAKTGVWSDPFKFDYVDRGNIVTSVFVQENSEDSFEVDSVQEDTRLSNEGDLR